MTTLGALVAIPAFGGHSDGTPEVTPTVIPGNPSCASVGLGNEFKIEPVADGTFSTTIAGLGSVSVTLDVDSTGRTFSFDLSDNVVALAVIVKGGPNANLYDYRPAGINHDDGLTAPRRAGLSHISFCLAEAPAELDIQKTPDGGVVDPGGTASFTLTVTNVSTTVTAKSVVIDDTLPSGLSWAEDPDKAECTVSGGSVLHCDVGDLAPGASFSVTVSASTDSGDCGEVNNPEATAGAGNADQVSDSGSLTVRCGAIKITKTAKHKDTSGATQPNLDAEFTIDDAGSGAPVVVRTGADGEVCVDGLHVGSATVTETGVPTGYDAPGAKTVDVTTGSCSAGTAVPASFENTPLTDVDISVDSQVNGATETVITCRDSNGNVVAQKTVSDGSLSLDNQKPQTLDCRIVIDP
jgi:uncharacterized repeat protein (TIGR01451 family)